MDEARLKLLTDADEEIRRVTGGNTEYLTWMGKSATVLTAVTAACKKLADLAKERTRPFTEEEKNQIERLELFGDVLALAALAIEQLGERLIIEDADGTPLAAFNALIRKYVAAHRVGYALWRGREEYGLLSRAAPGGRPN